MNNTTNPSSSPCEPATTEAYKNLVKPFQAYLHLVITAEQTGLNYGLANVPGLRMRDYCPSLASLPRNTLASELAKPVRAILEQIRKVSRICERRMIHKQVKDAAEQADLDAVLEQMDFALALIMRRLPFLVNSRTEVTKCKDLLCEEIENQTCGNGPRTARLIRRHNKMFPGEYSEPHVTCQSEGNFLYNFAWDTYERIEQLNQLAVEFPEHIRAAARRMHGWPMLMHRHTNNRRHFSKLARRLELGADYPIDASEGARFLPDSPLVGYLNPLIRRIHHMREELGDMQFKSLDDERSMLLDVWWWRPQEEPGEEELAALRTARQLPPLTKATANDWAEKALVPLILATDARDWENCREPVLHYIAKRRNVHTLAAFKSRLLAVVSAALRRLAWADDNKAQVDCGPAKDLDRESSEQPALPPENVIPLPASGETPVPSPKSAVNPPEIVTSLPASGETA
jgi:hypothetical protein